MITHQQRGSAVGRVTRPWRRWLSPDGGASAVEFALIVPFLLMLGGGIIEMANVFFVRSQLNEIVRDATRRLAVDALSQDAASNFIAERLAETTKAQADISISEGSEGGNNGNGTGKANESADELTDVTVSLSIALKDILIFDFIADEFLGTDEQAPKLSVAVTMLKH